jgi:hypothetical protein
LNRELTFDERISMVHGIWSRPDRDITVPPDAIISAGYVPGVSRLDERAHRWQIAAGAYDVALGSSAAAQGLRATASLSTSVIPPLIF